MTTKPTNEIRIMQLEREVSSLRALVESFRSRRENGNIDQIVRPARTCDPSTGSYPATGNVVPIKFLDVTHDGLETDLTKSERSAEQQAVASSFDGSLLASGTDVIAFRYGRKWFALPMREKVSALIKNISGQTVPEWGFLEVVGAIPLPSQDPTQFKAAPIFLGATPKLLSNFMPKRVVSVPGGAAVGETVECILDGRVPAKIYSQYKADPLMVQPGAESGSNGVTRLVAANDQSCFGYPVLYRETGTGEKWGIVDLMPQNAAQTFCNIWGNYGSPLVTSSTTQGPVKVTNFGPLRNGIPRVSQLNDWIRVDGPTAWLGELVLDCEVTVPRSVGDFGSFKALAGFYVKLEIYYNSVAGLTFRQREARYQVPPSAILTADVGYQGDPVYKFPLRVPFLFQSPAGLMETPAFEFQGRLTLEKLGVATTTQTVKLYYYAGLFMQEVDPLQSAYTPTTGSGSGSLLIESFSTPDPLISATGTPASGNLFIEGSSVGGSPGSGTGAGIE